MKKFDENYKLLSGMYQDGYFPDFLVDKIRDLIRDAVDLLETGKGIRESFRANSMR